MLPCSVGFILLAFNLVLLGDGRSQKDGSARRKGYMATQLLLVRSTLSLLGFWRGASWAMDNQAFFVSLVEHFGTNRHYNGQK